MPLTQTILEHTKSEKSLLYSEKTYPKRGYNLYGNRLTDTHLHNSSDSETYSYDTAMRLNAYDRNGGFSQDWTLDDLGNWTQFDDNGSIDTRTHNEVNEVTSTNSASLTYDDNGNLTWDGQRTLEWDALNRLTHIYTTSAPGALAQYFYNAMNLRVQKYIDTDGDGLLDSKTNYYYCEDKVCEEQTTSGTLIKNYVHGGQYIDEVIMESDSSSNLGSFYLCDQRYSTYALVDSNGTITERYRYTPYGEREVLSATFIPTGAPALTEFGFTGRRHDAEPSGLMYFRARYYSSELGRFVGRDPLGYIDGMNLYAGYFVPNHLDPYGESIDPASRALQNASQALAQGNRQLAQTYLNVAKTLGAKTKDVNKIARKIQKQSQKGGGKNAQHGNQTTKSTQQKQVQDLKDKLKDPKLSKREKNEIKRKIRNVEKDIARQKKGEQHSQKAKGQCNK